MSARTVGLWLWLAAGGLAAAALVWQLRHPPRLPTAAATGTAARMPELPAVTPLEPFHLPPADQYAGIVARPLFITARRPEPPPPDEAPPPPSAPTSPDQKFLLLGVMITPQTTVALLRPEEPNARIARLKPGEMLGEWRLETVFPRRVVLSKGQVTQEVVLARSKRTGGPRTRKPAGVKPPAGDAPPPVVPPAALPVAAGPPAGLPAGPPAGPPAAFPAVPPAAAGLPADAPAPYPF